MLFIWLSIYPKHNASSTAWSGVMVLGPPFLPKTSHIPLLASLLAQSHSLNDSLSGKTIRASGVFGFSIILSMAVIQFFGYFERYPLPVDGGGYYAARISCTFGGGIKSFHRWV